MTTTIKELKELIKDLPDDTEIETLDTNNYSLSLKRIVIASYKDDKEKKKFVLCNPMGSHLQDKDMDFHGST